MPRWFCAFGTVCAGLIANPHFCTLEDGAGRKRAGETQPAMKADMDPFALLNPGKMRSAVPAAA